MTAEHNFEPQWFIKVKDTIYGPYHQERMKILASENRLNARSLVSMSESGEYMAASDDIILATYFTQPTTKILEITEPDTSLPARRFVIFAQIADESHVDFMEILSGFGVAIEAMPSVWLLKASVSADRLRNTLSQALGSNDLLFIADASEGKSAWFNIGQDADGRIRQFWQDSE